MYSILAKREVSLAAAEGRDSYLKVKYDPRRGCSRPRKGVTETKMRKVTPAAHSAAFLEAALLARSGSLEEYVRPWYNDELDTLDEADEWLTKLRQYVNTHDLVGPDVFEESGQRWCVVEMGTDTTTGHKVAFYYDVDAHPDGVDSLDDCEYSSLKEVWAWKMRWTVSSELASFAVGPPPPGAHRLYHRHHRRRCRHRRHDHHHYRHNQHDHTAAATQGHAELADAVEHTLDICDDEEFAPHADIPVAPTLNGSRAERFEAVLEALDSVSVPEEGRKNVRQTPDQLLQGMVMGAVCYRKTGEVRS